MQLFIKLSVCRNIVDYILPSLPTILIVAINRFISNLTKNSFKYDNKLLNKCYYYWLLKKYSLESSKWVIWEGFLWSQISSAVHYRCYFWKTKRMLKLKKNGNIFNYLHHKFNVLFMRWELVLCLLTFQDGGIVWLRWNQRQLRIYAELIQSWRGDEYDIWAQRLIEWGLWATVGVMRFEHEGKIKVLIILMKELHRRTD